MARSMPGGSYDCSNALPPKALENLSGDDSDLPLVKVIRQTAANYLPVVSAGEGEPIPVIFFAHNPSPRLRFSISVGWELQPTTDLQIGPTPATWQMTAIRIPPAGGGAADLNAIFVNGAGVPTDRQLPDGYEVDSAVKDVRGNITCNDGPDQNLVAGQYGSLVIEARWEPHDGAIDRRDLIQLLERADLRVIQPASIGNAP